MKADTWSLETRAANLVLEGREASRRAGPSPAPDPPDSQTAPSGEAET